MSPILCPFKKKKKDRDEVSAQPCLVPAVDTKKIAHQRCIFALSDTQCSHVLLLNVDNSISRNPAVLQWEFTDLT